jgi:hypothetical protein
LNPFKSGRSFLELRPFYRSQQIDGGVEVAFALPVSPLL